MLEFYLIDTSTKLGNSFVTGQRTVQVGGCMHRHYNNTCGIITNFI